MLNEFLMEALAPEDNPNIQNGFVTTPYWYFTTHGVMPGSIPKDVKIEEIRDTEDGTYFSTFYLLNTAELKNFDIVEKSPINESVDTDFEDDDQDEIECEWCDELTPVDEILNTDLGKICPYCFDAIRSRGEKVVVFHEDLKQHLVEAVDNNIYFKAYITNLGKYNEGELVGEWVQFPIDKEEFKTILTNIGINSIYEEWFVSDYDCSLDAFEWQDLGEYPSFETLNDFGELVSSITDEEAINNIFEYTNNLKRAIEGFEDGSIIYYSGIKNNLDLGEYIINELYGGAERLDKSTLEEYLNFEDLGRELSFDSYGDNYELSAGEYFCGDEDASDSEIGETYVDMVGIDRVQHPEYYFEYEEFGRRYAADTTSMFTKDGFVEEI